MKILLLDDNDANIEIISCWLKSNYSENIIFKYKTAFSFVTSICDELKGEADLSVIHIADNNDKNIQMARDIQDYFPHMKVIFYSEKAICAEAVFQAVPSFFFKIPMDTVKVNEAFERIGKEIHNEKSQSLNIVSKGRMIRLRFEAIHYMESIGRKVCIYSSIGSYETNATMAEIMSKLPAYFYQCHRSYIVNLKKITSYNATEVCILDKDIIPVSRNVKTELRNKITDNY